MSNRKTDTVDQLARAALTQVELLWDQGRTERWIRFGRHVDEQILDRQRRVLFFAPNSLFALVRWAGNKHGTQLSCIDILRALTTEARGTSLSFIRPGGEVLLRIAGWPNVQSAFAVIDAIEQANFDPASICPDHWRHVHNRLHAGLLPRPYTRERHARWLARKELAQ
jgi:hypothetical protein